jgi:choline dehydrogenase-like flavoprotein
MPGNEFDVLIIGSGASGGTVARQLTQKGIRCLMLNAGPAVDFQRDRVLKKVYDLPYRGFGQPGRFLICSGRMSTTGTSGRMQRRIRIHTIRGILTNGFAFALLADAHCSGADGLFD